MTLPPPLHWLWEVWKQFAEALGRVMSWILLSVLWVVGFGVYAIILKVTNLCKPHKTPQTYWVDPQPDFPDSMKHQF